MASKEKLYKRLRIAGILLVVGMIIAAVTQIWIHPLTFMALAGLSIPLVVIGVLIYLYSAIISES